MAERRANRALVIATVLLGCAGVSGSDMGAARVTLIGFSHAGEMIVLETRGPAPELRATIEKIALPSGPRTVISPARPISELDVRSMKSLEGWLEPRGISPDSTNGRSIAVWNTRGVIPFALRIEVDAPLGDRREARAIAILDDPQVEARAELEVARIPIGRSLDAGPLYVSPDENFLVLAARDGPRASLYPIDARATHAALLNRAALDAYAEQDHVTAAATLEAAIRADPRAGDPVYNLACVHALMGDDERALAELQLAMAIDPARYTLLARTDPDLEKIRARPEICERLSSCDRQPD